MIRLLDRPLSSDDSVKSRRESICTKVIDVMDIFPEILHKLASEDSDGYGPLRYTKTVQFFRHLVAIPRYTDVVHAKLSIVLARVQERDASWFKVAPHYLGVSKDILRSHADNGDRLSLAILIHITRQQFNHLGNSS